MGLKEAGYLRAAKIVDTNLHFTRYIGIRG